MVMEEKVELGEFENVLVIVAHPDDAEFMAGGTIAKFAAEGKTINYVLCTNGNKGSADPEMTPDRLVVIRETEQRGACDVLGVKEIRFLGYEDGALRNTLELRMDIAREIRRFQPDLIICQSLHRPMGGRFLSHSDHRAAGDTAMDAIYPSSRDYHAFPQLIAEGFMPHKTLQVLVGMGGTDQANIWIDTSEVIETKINALRQHKSQIQDMEAMAERIRGGGFDPNPTHGFKHAEGFRYIQLGS